MDLCDKEYAVNKPKLETKITDLNFEHKMMDAGVES